MEIILHCQLKFLQELLFSYSSRMCLIWTLYSVMCKLERTHKSQKHCCPLYSDKNDKRSHTYSLDDSNNGSHRAYHDIDNTVKPRSARFMELEQYRLGKIPVKQISQAFSGTYEKNVWNTIMQHPLLYCCVIAVLYWMRFQVWLLTTNKMAIDTSVSQAETLCRTLAPGSRFSQRCQNSHSAQTQPGIVFYCCHKTF